MKKYLVGVFAGLAICAGLAFGAAQYGGFQAIAGVMVDAGTEVPVIAQSGQTISAQAGGANVGVWTATGATTGAGTLTFASAAPGGRVCDFNDETTIADRVTQTNATDGKTVVTIGGTIVSGDKIGYNCMAY